MTGNLLSPPQDPPPHEGCCVPAVLGVTATDVASTPCLRSPACTAQHMAVNASFHVRRLSVIMINHSIASHNAGNNVFSNSMIIVQPNNNRFDRCKLGDDRVLRSQLGMPGTPSKHQVLRKA
jgi:hypothetical protein